MHIYIYIFLHLLVAFYQNLNMADVVVAVAGEHDVFVVGGGVVTLHNGTISLAD